MWGWVNEAGNLLHRARGCQLSAAGESWRSARHLTAAGPRYDGLWIYLQPFPARSCSSASSYTARTAGADYLNIHEKCCVFSISLSFVLRGNGKRMHPKAWRRRDRELNSLCLFFLVWFADLRESICFFFSASGLHPNLTNSVWAVFLNFVYYAMSGAAIHEALLCSAPCWSYGYHIY